MWGDRGWGWSNQHIIYVSLTYDLHCTSVVMVSSIDPRAPLASSGLTCLPPSHEGTPPFGRLYAPTSRPSHDVGAHLFPPPYQPTPD